MLIAGIGGQGVVWLTKLIVEAAVQADIPAASSEIHGIAQRRGSVVAGVTFGDHAYGFVEEAEADFLIGLEPLEAMRCFSFLHRGSSVVIDDNRILPHIVNVGAMAYPDVDSFIEYLKKNVRQVICNQKFDAALSPVLRNVHILGKATQLEGFPLASADIEPALVKLARPGYERDTLRAFELGRTLAGGGQ